MGADDLRPGNGIVMKIAARVLSVTPAGSKVRVRAYLVDMRSPHGNPTSVTCCDDQNSIIEFICPRWRVFGGFEPRRRRDDGWSSGEEPVDPKLPVGPNLEPVK